MTIEVYSLKEGEPSPYQDEVVLWSYANVLERPEMVRRGISKSVAGLLFNLNTNRIELFSVDDGGQVMGGMIFTEHCDDLHFGIVPALLGSWCEDSGRAKALYRRALEVLKERGHKGILRTMRINEGTYKIIYKEI